MGAWVENGTVSSYEDMNVFKVKAIHSGVVDTVYSKPPTSTSWWIDKNGGRLVKGQHGPERAMEMFLRPSITSLLSYYSL